MKAQISTLIKAACCSAALLLGYSAHAQTNANQAARQAGVSINENGSKANHSAMLDVHSTSKGLLTPRMTTTEREAIVRPAQGLLVFDNTTSTFWYFDGEAWKDMLTSNAEEAGTRNSTGDNLGNHTATENIQTNGHWISNDGGNKGVHVATNGNVGVGLNSGSAAFQVGFTHPPVVGTDFLSANVIDQAGTTMPNPHLS